MKLNLFLKSIVGAFLLTLLSFLFNIILGFPHNILYYIWSIPANLLVALILGFYILHSCLKGMNLCVAVFIIFFIIGVFNILIEALIFNVTDRAETINEIIGGFFAAFIFSPVYVYLYGRWKKDSFKLNFEPRTIFSWIWRIGVVDVLYLFFYILAGFTLQALYPELLEFYKEKIPPFDLIFKTQFVRGLIFAVVAILILRTTDLKLTKRMIFIGSVFAILGGIAPLIPPNEFMPFHIRVAHGFEVGISNFIFGVLAGKLLGQKRFSTN